MTKVDCAYASSWCPDLSQNLDIPKSIRIASVVPCSRVSLASFLAPNARTTHTKTYPEDLLLCSLQIIHHSLLRKNTTAAGSPRHPGTRPHVPSNQSARPLFWSLSATTLNQYTVWRRCHCTNHPHCHLGQGKQIRCTRVSMTAF